MKKVDICVLAGIWTAPRFMETLCEEVTRKFAEEGWSAQGTLIYPYGDCYLSRMRQLREIALDLFPRSLLFNKILGGRRVADEIKPIYRGERLVLIGHSGGGVAAVHAAQFLMDEEGLAAPHVVQIGSPKCPIPSALRDRVTYVTAVNERGRWKDPVTCMGSWGMRLRRSTLVPAVREVPILGGHADYFRNEHPYIQGNTSNLQITINSFWRDLI
jgi:hypothetical protein